MASSEGNSWEKKGFDVKERLSYLDRNSTNFKKGLTVTTFYLAKGLEFDQVFAVFPQKDQSPLVRQARYIAATRALHELHMYEVEKSKKVIVTVHSVHSNK